MPLSVGPSTALDAAALLKALDRYPFGCSEQITSRALPLLYVNELASEAHLALDAAIDQRISDAIERLLARQGSCNERHSLLFRLILRSICLKPSANSFLYDSGPAIDRLIIMGSPVSGRTCTRTGVVGRWDI